MSCGHISTLSKSSVIRLERRDYYDRSCRALRSIAPPSRSAAQPRSEMASRRSIIECIYHCRLSDKRHTPEPSSVAIQRTNGDTIARRQYIEPARIIDDFPTDQRSQVPRSRRCAPRCPRGTSNQQLVTLNTKCPLPQLALSE